MNRTDEDEVVALINRMMAQGRRRERRYAAAAVILAIIAISASVGGWLAYDAARRGQQADTALVANYQHAIETIDAVMSRIADDAASMSGAPTGRLVAMIASAEERLDAFIDTTEPRDPAHLVRFGDILSRFAAGYLVLGEPSRALEAARRARDILEARSDAELVEHGGRRALAVALLAEGDALSDTGQSEAALGAYRRASELRRTLAEGEAAGPEDARGLALAYEREAQALFRTGDTPGGSELLERVIAMREAAVEAAPGDERVLSELLVAYSNLADHKAHAGEHDAAMDLYTEAVDTLDGMVAADPENSAWQELRARHLARGGRVALASGDSAAAGVRLNEARDIYGDLFVETPQNAAMEASLADVLDLLGILYRQTSDWPAARTALMQSMDIRRRQAERHVASDTAKRAFAKTMIELAQVDRAENLDEIGRTRVSEAVAILRDVASDNPQNAAAALDLARALRDASDFGVGSQADLQEAHDILQRLEAGNDLPEGDRPLLTDVYQRIGQPTQ